jgi:hypothetical protein
MMWTTRLKRYGGFANIQAIRAHQYAYLAKHRPVSVKDGRDRRGMKLFLDGHPLRVLNELLPFSPVIQEIAGF